MSCRDALRFVPGRRRPIDHEPAVLVAKPALSPATDSLDPEAQELFIAQVAAQEIVLRRWEPVENVDQRSASFLRKTVRAAREQGISSHKCNLWQKKCLRRYNALSTRDRQFYFARFTQLLVLAPPIASPPRKGQRLFTSAFDPARIFKPVAEYMKEDVQVRLEDLAGNFGFPLNDASKQQPWFPEWRQRLSNRLESYLNAGSYSEQVAIPVECELERLNFLARTFGPVFRNGKLKRLFEIDEIMRRVASWAVPEDITEELEDLKRQREIVKRLRTKTRPSKNVHLPSHLHP